MSVLTINIKMIDSVLLKLCFNSIDNGIIRNFNGPFSLYFSTNRYKIQFMEIAKNRKLILEELQNIKNVESYQIAV